MSTRWTDTTTFANLATPDDLDFFPIADASAADGSKQRTITVANLKTLLGSALVTVNSYAGATTLDADDDLGAHCRITAAGAVTIPPDLPVGWNTTIENATVSDTVTLAAGSGVTILSAGDEVTNGKWVALLVVSSDVVSAVGAFADEV